MFKNYISLAFRHLIRDLKTTSINIIGLTIGISAFFLIMLWVNYQQSYDTFHDNIANIYTVMADRSEDTRISIQSNTPFPLGEVLKEQSGVLRLSRLIGQEDILLVTDNYKQEEYIHFTDPAFLEMFSFEIISSLSNRPLDDQNAIVMTRSSYKKYFGNEPFSGQTVHIKSWGFEKDIKVTAIVADPPENSSIQFSFLMPVQLLANNLEWVNNWGTSSLTTYVELQDKIDHVALTQAIEDIPGLHHDWDYKLFLYPFSKNYLYNVFNDREGSGRIIYVYVFATAAVLILLLACINFTNLSTAQAGRRAREIGVRKTMGAEAGSIRKQVILEGILIALISAIFSLSFIQIIIPYYNDLLQTKFETGWISIRYVLIILGIAVVTGIISAGYPAIVYSRFNPTNVLKSSFASVTRLHWSKQALLVFQLVISVIMISSAVIIYKQVNYLNESELGFDKDNLMYFHIHENGAYEHHEDLAQRLKKHANIDDVTFLSQNPLQVYQTSGDPDWEGKNPETAYPPFSFIDTDYDVEKVLNLEIVNGRSFDRNSASDTSSFLINEKAAAIIGEDAIGKTMNFWDKEGRIIGVFKNFHHLSLHNEIKPMILRYWRGNTTIVFLRVNGEVQETLDYVKNIYNTYESEYPFSYKFVDEEFEQMYTAEKQIRTLAILFAVMAILIAVLGLYGLVSYVLQGQIKMIGIRKVMGATTEQMITLFMGRFSRWVIYSILIAIPLSYYLLKMWLENFAYRINIGLVDLLIGTLVICGITALTILLRVIRAARTNPAETLKNE